MTEENYYRVSVKGLVIENDKFLLAREANGIWEILGGGLDHGEDPMDCLKREVHEETGLTISWISPAPKFFVKAMRRNKKDYAANVIYEIKLKDLDFIPSDECQELKFFSLDEMAELNAYPTVRQLVRLLNEQR